MSKSIAETQCIKVSKIINTGKTEIVQPLGKECEQRFAKVQWNEITCCVSVGGHGWKGLVIRGQVYRKCRRMVGQVYRPPRLLGIFVHGAVCVSVCVCADVTVGTIYEFVSSFCQRKRKRKLLRKIRESKAKRSKICLGTFCTCFQ